MKIQEVRLVENVENEHEVVVLVEEYPHAQPVFPANISTVDLKSGLLAWEIAQKQADNPGEPVVVPLPDISNLKKLEGTVIGEP